MRQWRIPHLLPKQERPMSQRNRASALLWICAIATLIASSASAQDWPQWRGPNRDARAAALTPPQSWPKEIAPKWKINVGEGVATPSLVGDTLYVFSRQNGHEMNRCLTANTGEEI